MDTKRAPTVRESKDNTEEEWEQRRGKSCTVAADREGWGQDVDAFLEHVCVNWQTGPR